MRRYKDQNKADAPTAQEIRLKNGITPVGSPRYSTTLRNAINPSSAICVRFICQSTGFITSSET